MNLSEYARLHNIYCNISIIYVVKVTVYLLGITSNNQHSGLNDLYILMTMLQQGRLTTLIIGCASESKWLSSLLS